MVNMATRSPQHLARRADIQSLRALAIALVVAAHARIPGLQGGFVGVDVFFVLSGYLISGLILTEAETTGHFRAGAFYARRMKRLLPALFVVLAVSAIAAWVIAIPGQLQDATAGRAANFWLSNFYFAAREINYFSAGGGPNLFLHTWSLAVEEQFYLVWPWLLLFFYGTWSWQGKPRSQRRVFGGMILIGVLSLALGVYWSRVNSAAAFYLMPGRMWEFALGALVFLFRRRVDTGKHPSIERWVGRSRLNVTGWILILVAGSFYSGALRFPGFWALLPCTGAALVLLDTPEKRPHSIAARILTHQTMIQFLGNISYSLYLWHWPILLLGTSLFGRSASIRLGLVVLSIILASITYFSVENPIRRLRTLHPSRVLIPSAAAIVLGALAMNLWISGANDLLEHPQEEHIELARADAPRIYLPGPKCDTWFRSAQIVPCTAGPRHARHTVVMLGDSVLAQWLPAIKDIYLKKPGWRIVVLTKSACPASQISYYYQIVKATYSVCDIWRNRALKYLAHLRPDIAIVGSASYPFTRAQWIQGTRKTLKRLSPAVRHIFVLDPSPMLEFNGPDCLMEKAEQPRWLATSTKCARETSSSTGARIDRWLHDAAKSFPNVNVIDLDSSICPHHRCRARIGALITYRDAEHLTASYVRTLAPALAMALSESRHSDKIIGHKGI